MMCKPFTSFNSNTVKLPQVNGYLKSEQLVVKYESSAVARPNGQPRQAGVARGVRGHVPPPPRNFEL